MKNVVCNLCGKDDYKVLFPAGVAQQNQIVECKHCGLMYANPRSREEDCVQIQTWDPDFIEQRITTQERGRLEKEALQVRDYDSTRAWFGHQCPQRGKLLEIGSGLGYLLEHFRKDGWDTVGVEPDAGLCRYASTQLGLNVIPKLLHEAGIADESVDAVLMMHVIEHVPDPVEALREVRRVLRPGGLFVMETPRYDTLMFKLLGRRERSLSCEGHIYFFSSKTLAETAQQAGFKILKTEYVGRSLTLDRLLYNLAVVSKSKTIGTALTSISRRFGLNRIRLSLNLRDMERVYLTKPAH